MKIFWDLKSVQKNANSVLTVGTFDGIHLGHQYIIKELQNRAKIKGAQTTLVTFDPHPQLVLNAPNKPELRILTTTQEKMELLRNLGVDRVVILNFTVEFSNISSMTFVKNILFDTIGFNEIVIGYDHAFGKNREGDFSTLNELSKKFNFKVDKLPAFNLNGMTISSTSIRKLITTGNINKAKHILGRNYHLNGKVVRGEGRGQDLQFPTANLTMTSAEKLIPGNGVYAVYVYLKNRKLKGMMNIGSRPTFKEKGHTTEVHIFDFNDEIYGQVLKIEFIDRIRDEIQFINAKELVSQLKHDKEKCTNIL